MLQSTFIFFLHYGFFSYRNVLLFFNFFKKVNSFNQYNIFLNFIKLYFYKNYNFKNDFIRDLSVIWKIDGIKQTRHGINNNLPKIVDNLQFSKKPKLEYLQDLGKRYSMYFSNNYKKQFSKFSIKKNIFKNFYTFYFLSLFNFFINYSSIKKNQYIKKKSINFSKNSYIKNNFSFNIFFKNLLIRNNSFYLRGLNNSTRILKLAKNVFEIKNMYKYNGYSNLKLNNRTITPEIINKKLVFKIKKNWQVSYIEKKNNDETSKKKIFFFLFKKNIKSFYKLIRTDWRVKIIKENKNIKNKLKEYLKKLKKKNTYNNFFFYFFNEKFRKKFVYKLEDLLTSNQLKIKIPILKNKIEIISKKNKKIPVEIKKSYDFLKFKGRIILKYKKFLNKKRINVLYKKKYIKILNKKLYKSKYKKFKIIKYRRYLFTIKKQNKILFWYFKKKAKFFGKFGKKLKKGLKLNIKLKIKNSIRKLMIILYFKNFIKNTINVWRKKKTKNKKIKFNFNKFNRFNFYLKKSIKRFFFKLKKKKYKRIKYIKKIFLLKPLLNKYQYFININKKYSFDNQYYYKNNFHNSNILIKKIKLKKYLFKKYLYEDFIYDDIFFSKNILFWDYLQPKAKILKIYKKKRLDWLYKKMNPSYFDLFFNIKFRNRFLDKFINKRKNIFSNLIEEYSKWVNRFRFIILKRLIFSKINYKLKKKKISKYFFKKFDLSDYLIRRSFFLFDWKKRKDFKLLKDKNLRFSYNNILMNFTKNYKYKLKKKNFKFISNLYDNNYKKFVKSKKINFVNYSNLNFFLLNQKLKLFELKNNYVKILQNYKYWGSFFYSWSWSFLYINDFFNYESKIDYFNVRSKMFFSENRRYNVKNFFYITHQTFKNHKFLKEKYRNSYHYYLNYLSENNRQSLSFNPSSTYKEKKWFYRKKFYDVEKPYTLLIRNHYSNTLRFERNKVKLFFLLKFRYQYTLTHWLYRFKLYYGLKLFLDWNCNVLNSIQNSKFVSGFENVRYLLSQGMCFINGRITSNSSLPVFSGDILAIKFGWQFYIYIIYINKIYKYNNILRRYFSNYVRKFKKKQSNDVMTKSTKALHYGPNEQFLEIPYYIETDYMTMTAVILTEPDYNYILKKNLHRFTTVPILSLFHLNWKYIV